MNVSLETYIKRSDEILSTKNKQVILDNEFKIMISYLENTLLELKKKYVIFKKELLKNNPEDSKKNINENIEENNSKQKIIKTIKTINFKEFLPNKFEKCNLVWIPDINQYSLKINNLVLRGNLAIFTIKKCYITKKFMLIRLFIAQIKILV